MACTLNPHANGPPLTRRAVNVVTILLVMKLLGDGSGRALSGLLNDRAA
jgi:hypothetical protein